MTGRTITAAIALTLALAACGDGASDRSEALCADLHDGLTPMNIYGGVSDDMTPEEFAGQVFVAVDEACPEWRDDPGIRNLLEGWGYLTLGDPWPES